MPLPNEVRPPGGQPRGAVDEAPGDGLSGATLPPAADIATACQAYVVLLLTPAGKYRRRVFLSLHSATAAIQRAQDKGQPARMVLCQLVPVAPDLDLGGEWTE
jgi:hypothetical protein